MWSCQGPVVIAPHPGSPNSPATLSACLAPYPSQSSYLFLQAAQVVPALDSPHFNHIPPTVALGQGIAPQPETAALSHVSLHETMSGIKRDIANIIRTLEEFCSTLEILHTLHPAIAPMTAEILALN